MRTRAFITLLATNLLLEDSLFESFPNIFSANTEDSSHLHVEFKENGEPLMHSFTYVDESSCIGCTYCAQLARSTFFMEEYYGKARVFDQGGDTEEVILEAIDCCPVDCIYTVSYKDLVNYETIRDGKMNISILSPTNSTFINDDLVRSINDDNREALIQTIFTTPSKYN